MKRQPEALDDGTYDLLIVGGGIFGICVAHDAALRGLDVVLLEKGDFAHATTANSYKIVHGGIRYLQHADPARTRSSCRERSILLRIAPHLVHPMPILMPTYGHGARGKELLWAGFKLYDLLTADRNRGIDDPSRRIPPATFLSREEALRRFPGIESDGLTGGAIFHDGQMYNPPRLALSFLRTATEAGADAVNYMEVTDLLRDGGRIVGAEATDQLSGRKVDIRSRLVLNAAGPWAPRLLENALDLELGESGPTFSRDVGLVTTRQLNADLGIACSTRSSDADAVVDRGGRHLFLLPWRQHTLVGVWHGVFTGDPDRVAVGREELGRFVDDANRAYPGLELTTDEVSMVNTGLILFGGEDQDPRQHEFGHESVIVDHEARHGLRGLLTLIGVRATMARGVAVEVVDTALRKLGEPHVASTTDSVPVYGGEVGRMEEHVREVGGRTAGWLSESESYALARNYGSRYDDVLEFTDGPEKSRGTLTGSTVLRAEVEHAVDREMAVRLSDVVLRRTDLGTAERPAPKAVAECAALMSERLGWSDERRRVEIAEVEAFFDRAGAARAYDSPAPEPGDSEVRA